jgi:hypothetical protein
MDRIRAEAKGGGKVGAANSQFGHIRAEAPASRFIRPNGRSQATAFHSKNKPINKGCRPAPERSKRRRNCTLDRDQSNVRHEENAPASHRRMP